MALRITIRNEGITETLAPLRVAGIVKIGLAAEASSYRGSHPNQTTSLQALRFVMGASADRDPRSLSLMRQPASGSDAGGYDAQDYHSPAIVRR